MKEDEIKKEAIKKKDVVIVPDMDFYTLEQAALKIGLGEITLKRGVENKELKAFTKNREKYIFHSDLVAYIRLGGDALENKAKSNLPQKPKPTKG